MWYLHRLLKPCGKANYKLPKYLSKCWGAIATCPTSLKIIAIFSILTPIIIINYMSVHVFGGFHVVARIIRELKSHMILYKFKCSSTTWIPPRFDKLQPSQKISTLIRIKNCLKRKKYVRNCTNKKLKCLFFFHFCANSPTWIIL